MEAAAADVKVKARGAGTEYVVLRAIVADGAEAWVVAGETAAAHKEDAIRHVVAEIPQGDDAVYRALPVRSWKGAVRIRTETVVRTKTEIID